MNTKGWAESDGASPQQEAGEPTPPRVTGNAFLTLHYRISLADRDEDVANTFGGKPATLQLGLGQLAEPLEGCLIEMSEGEHRVFELEPGHAFGNRHPQLIQTLSRDILEQHGQSGEGGADERYEVGDLVEFPAPDGGRFAGVLKRIDDESAVFDFNHPLAGQRLRFEVQILSVL